MKKGESSHLIESQKYTLIPTWCCCLNFYLNPLKNFSSAICMSSTRSPDEMEMNPQKVSWRQHQLVLMLSPEDPEVDIMCRYPFHNGIELFDESNVEDSTKSRNFNCELQNIYKFSVSLMMMRDGRNSTNHNLSWKTG